MPEIIETKDLKRNDKIQIAIEEWEQIKLQSQDTLEIAIKRIAELTSRLK